MGKVNRYEMQVFDDRIPIIFNWTGYDYLLGSHYDNYIFKYSNYEERPIKDEIFEGYLESEIEAYADNGDSVAELDPMGEFMGEDSTKREQDLDNEFESFKKVSYNKILLPWKTSNLMAHFITFD